MTDPSAPSTDLLTRVEVVASELAEERLECERLKAKNRGLNRRCQELESAVAETARRQGPTMTRGIAVAECERLRARIAELEGEQATRVAAMAALGAYQGAYDREFKRPQPYTVSGSTYGNPDPPEAE